MLSAGKKPPSHQSCGPPSSSRCAQFQEVLPQLQVLGSPPQDVPSFRKCSHILGWWGGLFSVWLTPGEGYSTSSVPLSRAGLMWFLGGAVPGRGWHSRHLDLGWGPHTSDSQLWGCRVWVSATLTFNVGFSSPSLCSYLAAQRAWWIGLLVTLGTLTPPSLQECLAPLPQQRKVGKTQNTSSRPFTPNPLPPLLPS